MARRVYSQSGDLVLSVAQRRVLTGVLSALVDAARNPGDLSLAEAAAVTSSLLDVTDVFPELAERVSIRRFYGRVAAASDVKRGEPGTYRQIANRHEQAFARTVSVSKRAVA